MVPLGLYQDVVEAGETSPAFDQRTMDLINHLRLVSLDCRASARTDLFEACAILSNDRNVARTAHAEALMKCLSQALGKAPKMLRPGVAEMSFDEAWLARLSDASRRRDDASMTFLLRSRVSKNSCRSIAFLINAISDRFAID